MIKKISPGRFLETGRLYVSSYATKKVESYSFIHKIVFLKVFCIDCLNIIKILKIWIDKKNGYSEY